MWAIQNICQTNIESENGTYPHSCCFRQLFYFFEKDTLLLLRKLVFKEFSAIAYLKSIEFNIIEDNISTLTQQKYGFVGY